MREEGYYWVRMRPFGKWRRMSNIKLDKVDSVKLPDSEVLAVNKNNYMLIGYLGVYDGRVFCEIEEYLLDDVTHFINLDDLLKIPRT